MFQSDVPTGITILCPFDFGGGTAASASIIATRVGSLATLPDIT